MRHTPNRPVGSDAPRLGLALCAAALAWLVAAPATTALAATVSTDAAMAPGGSGQQAAPADSGDGGDDRQGRAVSTESTMAADGDGAASAGSGSNEDLGKTVYPMGGQEGDGGQGDGDAQGGSGDDAQQGSGVGGVTGTDADGGSQSGAGGTPGDAGAGSEGTGGAGDASQGGDGTGSGDATDDSDGAAADVPDAGCAQVVELGADGYFEAAEGYGNAIQRAIDAALAAATDKKDADGNRYARMTIVVYKGTYDGNLTVSLKRAITADGSTTQTYYDLPDGFVLVLVADEVRGATTADELAAATGEAVVNGSLTVEDVSVELAGLWFKSGSITVKKGDAKDRSAAVDHFTFNGTAQDDGVSITLTEVKRATITTGDGADAVSVTISRGELASDACGAVRIDTGAGNDTLSLSGAGGAGGYAITATTGAGDDVITVNTSLRSAANDANGGSVSVDAGAGADRIHFAGSLTEAKNLAAGAVAIAGDRDAVTIFGGLDGDKKDTGSVTVRCANLESYTDELSHKTTVKLELGADGICRYEGELASFTNYEVAGDKIVSLVLTNAGLGEEANARLFLASLLTSAKTIYQIVAPMLNVFNVCANASTDKNAKQIVGYPDGDGAALKAAYGLESDFVGIRGRNIVLRDSDSDAYKSDALVWEIPAWANWAIEGKETIDLATWNFNVDAYIELLRDATLEAGECVIIEASCEQTKGMLPTDLPYVSINCFTLKWGTAYVFVRGTVTAGVNLDVSATGTIKVDVSSGVIPFAIDYGALDVGVFFDGATVRTGGSVRASSGASVDLDAITTAGYCPIMVAIDLGFVYSEVEVKDSAITAGGDVRLVSTSSLTQDAKAKYDGSTSSSGGFFTVAVADQESKATIVGASDVAAGGDADSGAADAHVAGDAGKDGTLTWTAGTVNGQDYVEIYNKNRLTTTDGAGETVLTGGTCVAVCAHASRRVAARGQQPRQQPAVLHI